MAVEVVDKVVDLSRYSDICKQLEQQLDVTAVGALNDQIKELTGLGLAGASIKSGSSPYKGTGDGAIIALNTSAEASLFAEKLHKTAEERNLGRDVELAQRHFRVGIWPGKFLLRPELHGKGYPTTFDFDGTTIANAVRLEDPARRARYSSAPKPGRTYPPMSGNGMGPRRSSRGSGWKSSAPIAAGWSHRHPGTPGQRHRAAQASRSDLAARADADLPQQVFLRRQGQRGDGRGGRGLSH